MGIGTLPNVNFTQQKRAVKSGISVCSHITRLMNNQTKAKERPLFTQKKRKRRQECGGYCENCATIELRLARLGSIGFSKRKTVRGKPDEKKSWDRFEEYGSLSLRDVKQVPGKRKDHRLEKYKSNLNISEVPTL